MTPVSKIQRSSRTSELISMALEAIGWMRSRSDGTSDPMWERARGMEKRLDILRNGLDECAAGFIYGVDGKKDE